MLRTERSEGATCDLRDPKNGGSRRLTDLERSDCSKQHNGRYTKRNWRDTKCPCRPQGGNLGAASEGTAFFRVLDCSVPSAARALHLEPEGH